jgi:hypothetical protein
MSVLSTVTSGTPACVGVTVGSLRRPSPLGRAVRGHEGQRRQRLKELEGQNARLKKLLAEAELDKAMLKELVTGNF